jgi:hypothetical protein
MTRRVDNEPKSCRNQTIFSYSSRQTKIKIKLTPKITAVLTGHRMTKAYLHRFHLSEDAKCKCGNKYQSMDHILFHSEEINAQREPINCKWVHGRQTRKTS